MKNNIKQFPETAVYSNNCLEDNYIFKSQAKVVFDHIRDVMDSFYPKDSEKDKNTYFNNTVGITGGRGSGKTSLLSSILKTIVAKNGIVYNDSDCFLIPLSDLIDPKVLPNNISIVNYVLSLLFSDFRNKAIKFEETAVNKLFQQFDKLNTSISLLSRVFRQDTIDNPSDLYDIGKTIDIKNDFETLVQELLKMFVPNTKKASFIVSIDDFDLDSSNVQKMIMDIITFLPIRGLIFLISFDEEILRDEIIRNRIITISNYGINNAFQYRDPRLSVRTWFFNPADIISKAEKYYLQNYNKFIPRSLRVDMWSSNNYNDNNLHNLLAELSTYLFGFPRSSKMNSIFNNDYHKFILAQIDEFCNKFYSSISNLKDLRSRNQLLNQIVKLLPFDESFNSNLKAKNKLADSLKEIGLIIDSETNEERLFLNSIVGCLTSINNALKDYTIYYEDNDTPVQIQELVRKYWFDHPCAPLLFEEIVAKIYDDDFSRKMVALIEVLRGEILVNSNDDYESVQIDSKTYTVAKFEFPSMIQSGRTLGRNIQTYLLNNKNIAKYQLQKFVDSISNYYASLDEEDIILSRRIETMKELIKQPWKGAESVKEYRSIARNNLNYCARRLIQR